MKKYIFKVKSQVIFDLLIKIAKDNNILVCDEYEHRGWTVYPLFTFRNYNGELSVVGNIDRIMKEVIELSLEEMIEVLNNKPVTLNLTPDYTAVIDYESKHVLVGCQSIPFYKVEALYRLIQE